MGRVRLGVGIGLSLYFWTVLLIQDQQNILIQEHVYLKNHSHPHRTWFYQVRHVPGSTSLLTLEQTLWLTNQNLKNQFIVFVKFRLTISVWCLYISVIHLSFPLILGIYSWLRLGFRCRNMVKTKYFWLKCCSRVNKLCWPRNTSN